MLGLGHKGLRHASRAGVVTETERLAPRGRCQRHVECWQEHAEPRDQTQCRREVARSHASPELEEPKAGADLLHLGSALEEILIRCDQANPKSAPDAQDPRVQRALDYLMLHFSELLTIPALAKICGLSPARFTRLFHRETCLPPIRYLEEIRLTRACRLLALTQDKIASIAGQVGFENPFYFTLRFKRYTGQSPSQYRQNHATGEHEKGAGQIT